MGAHDEYGKEILRKATKGVVELGGPAVEIDYATTSPHELMERSRSTLLSNFGGADRQTGAWRDTRWVAVTLAPNAALPSGKSSAEND